MKKLLLRSNTEDFLYVIENTENELLHVEIFSEEF